MPDVLPFGKIPARRKQLIVLVVVALWLSFLLSIASNDFGRKAYQLPIEDSVKVQVTMDFLVFSVPAILFGGILFWWFGRKERDERSMLS
jgi:hypothetical protein